MLPRQRSRSVIRAMAPTDWPAVAAIHQQGIDGGDATFETTPSTWDRFDASRLAGHRLVAASADGEVLGWAAVSPVSQRAVYAGVVEHSVYVRAEARGQGIGGMLLRGLISSTEAAGIWTIQGVVFRGNAASIALHERAGFRVVGYRERIAAPLTGPRAGVWQDTVLLERRTA